MNHTTMKSLFLSCAFLSLTACRSDLLDLSGPITSVSGQVSLKTSNGDALSLVSTSVGKAVSASIYDNNGNAEMSLKIDGEVDPLLFQLDQTTDAFKTEVDALNAQAQAANQNASISLTAGANEPVQQTWTATNSCVVSTYTVTVCGSPHAIVADAAAAPRPPSNPPPAPPNGGHQPPPPPPPPPVCHQEEHTVYGTATFEYVKSGTIYHDNLSVVQSSGSMLIDLVDDETSVSSTQISSCIP